MITRIEYVDGDRRAEIDRMDDCEWRVWVCWRWPGAILQADTVWRHSLTSAQSTAREFLRTGKWPK